MTSCPLPALPRAGGTYGLGLALPGDTECTIGALGHRSFPAGLYLYVGSAWGPGGIGARLGRHMCGGATAHWHIDYLRPWTTPVALWLSPGEHLECAWAKALAGNPSALIVVPRFGASDCGCASHFFRIDQPALAALTLPGVTHRIFLGTDGLWR